MQTKTLATVIFPWCFSLMLSACSEDSPQNVEDQAQSGKYSEQSPEEAWFVDVATDSGLDFVHWNGMNGENYFVEAVGSGAALADFDNDGDLDVFLVQGAGLHRSGSEHKPPVFTPPAQPGGRLFRNDLKMDSAGRTVLQFADITQESGIEAMGYGMGAAAADYDNDGRIDLYITNFGSNQLWRNVTRDGPIRFQDVTHAAGVDDSRWSTSATFADINADGWLDLFVTNYVDYSLVNHRICRSPSGRPDYCGPQTYNGLPDSLFINRGNGTFEDRSIIAGIAAEPSSGLGVVATDVDGDGRLDIYVANDQRRNLLWHNIGRKENEVRFEETALQTGVAVSMDGRAQASMGVVAGDIDNDGDEDLFMTHLSADTNTIFVNDGTGFFSDRSSVTGLGGPSLPATGFGTALIDFDNDGWLDLIAANGEVRVIEAQVNAGEVFPLKQANQLFRNRGDGRFDDVSGRAGREFRRLEVSRGIAVGDIDNDGRSDVIVTNNSGPARLLHNRDSSLNHWLGLKLLTKDGRDALGTRVFLTLPDGTELRRRAAADGSYLSSSDPRILIGLGAATEISELRVDWMGGGSESWTDLEINRYHTLVQGRGEISPAID